MKKKIFAVILFFVVLSVHASTSFNLKKEYKLNLDEEVISKFPNENSLTYEVKRETINEKIEDLSRKITYLLLGNRSYQQQDTIMDYYNRMEEIVKYIYDPDIPQVDGKDDTTSQEYLDSYTANLVVSNIFDQINELDVVYSGIDEIMVYRSDRFIISTVFIPNVLMKEEDPDNTFNYRKVKVNLVMYYYFLENKGEYQLYNIIGKPTDSVDDYLSSIERNSKINDLNILPEYDDSLNKIYKNNELNAITGNTMKAIYEKNKNKLATIVSYSNENRQYKFITGNGFLINKGIVVTSWDLLYNILKEGLSLEVVIDGKGYKVEGIITVNRKSNIALIKLVDNNTDFVTLSNDINVGDPVISITKKEVGYSANKGLLIANEGYYQSTIPVSNVDIGGALFNIKGEVIGMTTGDLLELPTSSQVPYEALLEAQNKFKDIDFSTIKTVKFDDLKESFFTKLETIKEEDNLTESKWNEINELTGIKNALALRLVRSNYDNGMVTLRYRNLFNDNDDILLSTSSFRESLTKKGFVEDSIGATKMVYKKDNKRVIIMKDFEYIVIMMVI